MNYFKRISLLFALAVFLFTGISANEQTHVVARGETIFSISRLYSVSADDLMRANNITDPSRLQAGRRLTIPSSTSSTSSPARGQQTPANTPQAPAAPVNLTDYRVVRGDTLFGIARNNGITLQTLLDINRFSSNHVLRVGDVIKVPSQGAVSAAQNNQTRVNPAPAGASGLLSLRWPIVPKDITYMSGQMGVVVEGEFSESVRSLTQGQVISAGPWRKFGRVVIVETAGGYFYMYGGCETLSVRVGDKISPGTEVGRLGINAVSERPQLFFMVFRNDTPIDPALAPRAGDNSRT